MPTVNGYTAERMKEIEDKTVVGGSISGDNLVLVTRDGTPIVAGNVRGPEGDQGPIGQVSTAQLNAAITAAVNLVQGAGAVTTAMIALGAITENRLADSSVTTAKLANGAVTTLKLADGAVTSAKITNGSVGSNELAASAVTNAKIGPQAITYDKVAIGAIGRDLIAGGAVDYWRQSFVFVQSTQPPVVHGGVWIIP